MNTVGLALVMQLALAADAAETYGNAHQAMVENGLPMVVMVGAEWCPACRVMETSVIPEVRRRGLLRRVAFAVVNVDHDQQLGKALTSGGPIPQLLMYRQTAAGWRLRRLVGGQSVETVQSFIADGVKLNDAEKLAHQDLPPKPATPSRNSTPALRASLSIESPAPEAAASPATTTGSASP